MTRDLKVSPFEHAFGHSDSTLHTQTEYRERVAIIKHDVQETPDRLRRTTTRYLMDEADGIQSVQVCWRYSTEDGTELSSPLNCCWERAEDKDRKLRIKIAGDGGELGPRRNWHRGTWSWRGIKKYRGIAIRLARVQTFLSA